MEGTEGVVALGVDCGLGILLVRLKNMTLGVVKLLLIMACSPMINVLVGLTIVPRRRRRRRLCHNFSFHHLLLKASFVMHGRVIPFVPLVVLLLFFLTFGHETAADAY
jgi:hypothetical protein